jgi:hypothetical protein
VLITKDVIFYLFKMFSLLGQNVVMSVESPTRGLEERIAFLLTLYLEAEFGGDTTLDRPSTLS